MNPLFAAHLVADFLLQPTWMVQLKRKSLKGIIVHALMNLLVMSVFFVPQTVGAWSMILSIAALHGIIDHVKIRYHREVKKQSFVTGFMVDQAVHLTVLLIASRLYPFFPPFWLTEKGIGILFLLGFFSFAMAWYNLSALKETRGSPSSLFLLIAFVFLMFMIPASVLAASTYGAL